MNKTIFYHLLALLLLFGITTTANAQVTIGASTKPSAFSVLELSTASTKGGLRLPHLTPQQRNDLDFESLAAKPSPTADELAFLKEAQGLTIFNTTSQCLEYWDTREWISLCTSSASFSFNNPTPPSIDGAAGGETDPIKPEGGGGCTQSPPYTVEIVAGMDYVVSTDIVTDATTGEFVLNFHSNPTAFPRYVIVRVTDNCTNLFRDLPFQQTGNLTLCQGDPVKIPVINSKGGGAGVEATVCNGGEVALWLTNTDDTYTYIWTLNGIEIQGATGTTYTATKGGDYGVVVGAMGCMNGISAAKKMVEDKTNPTGPAPLITATNSGVICGGNAVILNANNGTTPVSVDWYRDGVFTTTGTTKTINAAADAGTWTAYASDPCGSKRSNPLSVDFDASTPSGLADLDVSINGIDVVSNPEICKGGSMTIEVTNAADYVAYNPKYTWLINGEKVREGSAHQVIISVPNTANMNLEVQLVTSGNCPLSKDYNKAITPTELAKPKLNGGVTEAFICGTAQGVRLRADIEDATTYEWVRNNIVKEITATSTVDYREAGSYQVRYKKGNCWSPLSNPIELKYQAYLSLSWDNNTPPKDEVIGTVLTLGAYTAPEAVSYEWTSSDPSIIKVTPLLGNNRFATVEYLAIGTATITVKATNECGSKELEVVNVKCETGCTPIDNLNFTAKPATGTSGEALTYTLQYTGGGAVINDHKFDWVVKNAANVVIHTLNLSGSTGNSFNYTFATNGKYTVEVTAYDVCQLVPDRKKISQPVTINPSEAEVGVITPAPSGTYSMSGAMCYDIAKSGLNLASRKSSFLDASNLAKYEFPYEILTTATITDISVFTLGTGASVLLANAPTLNGKEITLKFSPSGVNGVSETGLSFDLVVLFKNGANQYKLVKNITVKDQACCGAATISGGWLTFMCHNLGADQNANPLDFSATNITKLYGDLYQWGRKEDGHEKRTSTVNAGVASGAALDAATGQIASANVKYGKFITNSASPYDWRNPQLTTLWGDGTQNEIQTKSQNDPCPTGWKVPSQKQWASIYSNMTTPNKWEWKGNGWMVGTALFLPAAGYRRNSNASLNYVASLGYYWYSTVFNTDSYYLFFSSGSVYPALNYNRAYGFSVRCVAE